MRRLDYLQSLKADSLSQSSSSFSLKDDYKAQLSSSEEPQISRASKEAVNPGYHQDRESAKRETVLRLQKLTKPCFWPFRAITLKFGSTRLVISTGRIMLSCLLVLIYYLLRRKLTTLKRYVCFQIKCISLFLLAISMLVPCCSALSWCSMRKLTSTCK